MDPVGALVLEPCRIARQQGKTFRVFFAQTLSCAETVHHDAVAAFGRVLQAIEDLQRRHRIAIGVVGMRLQAQAGIGQVGRVHLGPHFEILAIVGFADKAEHPGVFDQRAFAHRAVHQLGKAEACNGIQPVALDFRIVFHLVPIKGWGNLAAVPGLDTGCGASEFGRLINVIGVALQPVARESHGFAFGRECDSQASVFHQRGADPGVSRNVANGD